MNYRDITAYAIISLCAFVTFTWFRGHPLLFGSDTALPLNLKCVDQYFYILPLNSAYGQADASKFSFLLPLGLLIKMYGLSGLPFSASAFEKMWIYVAFAFSGVSAYFFLTTIHQKLRLSARLFASLFYMFNFYFLWLWIDVSYIPIVYAFFPLIFALYIRGVEQRKGLSYAITTALVWTFTMSPGYGQPWVATSWSVILSFLIFYSITFRDSEQTKKAFLFTFYLAIVWFAFNALWILPVASSFHEELSRHAIPGVSSWQLFEGNSVTIVDALRFMGLGSLSGSYKGSPYLSWYGIYESPSFVTVSFLVPVIASIALVVKRSHRNVIYFGILAAIFVFLAKGPNPPFGSVNTFLFSKFNLDFIFRSPYSRFMGYVVLAYTVLIAFAIDWIVRLKPRKRSLDALKWLSITIFFVSLVIVLPHPLWTGSLYDQSGIIPSRRVDIPSYYYEAAEWADRQEGNFNILPLPFPTRNRAAFSWANGTKGYRATYPFSLLSSNSFMINDFGNHTGSSLARLVVDGHISNSSLLAAFNVRYIFLHRDANWQYIIGNDEWVSNTADQTQKALGTMDGLAIEKTFGKIDVYRNDRWKPACAYSLPRTTLENASRQLLSGENNSVVFLYANPITNREIIKMNKMSPTLYTAAIHTTHFFILILNVGYDKQWIASVNGKEYEPFSALGFANGYIIDQTGDLEITFEYTPQRWLYYGAIISSISFLAFAGYLSYVKRGQLRSFLCSYRQTVSKIP